tara:strand:- start:197 stop:487 length:291 start_codon:yes stop_codon:yes gene_type:complete
MRTKGAKTNKDCWYVKINQGDIILHEGNYKTLKEAGIDLGLTYSQVCELGPHGRNKKRSIRFKFMPNILIEKIAPISHEEQQDITSEQEDPSYVPT